MELSIVDESGSLIDIIYFYRIPLGQYKCICCVVE